MSMAETQAAPAPVAQEGQTPIEGGEQPQAEAPTEDNPDLSKRFAALTRRERAIMDRDRAIKEREKTTNERWDQVEKFNKTKDSFSENPFGAIDALGLDRQEAYKAMSNFILNDEQPSFEDTAKSRIAKLEERLEAETVAKEAAGKQAEIDNENKLIDTYKRGLAQSIAANAEQYEIVGAYGDEGSELAYNIAEQYFEEHNEILTPDKALQMAEDHLESQFKEKFIKLNKVSKLMAGLNQTPEESAPNQGDPQTREDMTLTNRVVAESSSYKDSFDHMADDDESKKRAAQFLKWES